LEELMIKALAAGTLVVGGLISAPFALPALAIGGPLNASGAEADVVIADRIGRAFASLSEATVEPENAAAVAGAPKGDFAPACANAPWPNIEAGCLAAANGHPASHIRTITIGYQAGDNITVLVRIPAAEIALR
jgi:hypothetical protein